MNDILMYNKYISLFTKLYNFILSNKDKHIEEIEGLQEFYAKKNKPFRKKYEISDYAKKYYITQKANYELEEFIAEECSIDDIVSFNSIWQFCQFVRFAEKVTFYQNIPTNNLYVDSDMLDVKERLFIINNKSLDYQLKFKLEKVNDSITKQECKVITLNVCRLYGKKMNNIFTIVDEDIKINDQSDEYLINTINIILEREMKKVLKKCISEMIDTIY